MPRPRRKRCIRRRPEWNIYKPKGVPLSKIERINLNSDELEALRLKHKKEKSQEAAAEEMDVSRSTFSRILGEANKKITEALVEGHALKIEDPEYVKHVKPRKKSKRGVSNAKKRRNRPDGKRPRNR